MKTMKPFLLLAHIALFAIPAAQGFMLPPSTRNQALLMSNRGVSESGQSGANDIVPDVDGKVHIRPVGDAVDENYVNQAYQYATSSNPRRWTPASITYVSKAEDHADIKEVIKFAKENDLSVAIRSGGHQYLGFSSTNGRNIQIDMSSYSECIVNRDEDGIPQSLTTEACVSLKEIDDVCHENRIFYPHGECTHVKMGGHVQTGGYSAFSRSFGVMIDYVQWFEIITADTVVRNVTKPTDSTSEENNDLWFSVLGGSPGNLGVITRVNVGVLQDEDHETRALILYLPYTKECLEETLNIAAEFNDDLNLPLDYNFNFITQSEGSFIAYDIDEPMLKKYGPIHGKKDESNPTGYNLQGLEKGTAPSMILFGAVYSSVEEKDIGKAVEWLEHLDRRMERFKIARGLHAFMSDTMGVTNVTASTPMSAVYGKYVMKWAREYDGPCEKRTWAGTSLNLQKKGFAKWAARKLWDANTEGLSYGCKALSQFIPYSNRTMVASGKENNPTALGHRVRTKNSISFNFFYESDEPARTNSWEWGNKWLDSAEDSCAKAGIGGDGAMGSNDDLRFLYAPWGDNSTSWGKETNLDEMWRYYYDNEEVYNRLLRVKKQFDPNHVFTPNSFSVGYNDMIGKRGRRLHEVVDFDYSYERKSDWEMISKNYEPLLKALDKYDVP